MKEIKFNPKNPIKLTRLYRRRIKEMFLIMKAVTLPGIFEGILYKLRNTKRITLLSTVFVYQYIQHRRGLEIGGPSWVFGSNGAVPLYDLVESIDNVNYSGVTIWDSLNNENLWKCRKTIVSEASDLSNIEPNSYDIVVSSNVLEHLSNPLLSLQEMKRVVRLSGLIIVIVPHHDVTFDHKRPITSINSLIEVFKQKPSEGDITHLNLQEIFRDYDLDLDPPAGDLDSFRERTLNNKSNRALHQTVFNTQLLLEMFNWAEIEILFVRTSLILGHILVIGTKSNNSNVDVQTHNLRFLMPDAYWRKDTIFRSERK